MFVFGEATTTSAENIASGSKIYMPVNLTNGQTVNLTKTDGGGDVDTAVNTALQDTSLITYNSVEADASVTVTATEVGQTTVESNLGVTSNKAKALSQAYQAAINDTVADSGAEDAFF
jgi:phage tail sheath gpL-like